MIIAYILSDSNSQRGIQRHDFDQIMTDHSRAQLNASEPDQVLPHTGSMLPSNPFAYKAKPPVPKEVLYKGKGMLFFRFVVRAKLFQLLGFFTVAMLAGSILTTVSKLNHNP